MPSTPRRFSLAAAALAAVLVVTAAPDAGAATPQTTTDPAKAAAGWLVQQFVDASGKPSPSGDHFETSFGFDGGQTAAGIFALAAAKAGKTKIDAATSSLATHFAEYADLAKAFGGPFDGSVAKAALAAIVAGADPRDFGGFDLLKMLKDDECPASSTTCTPGAAAGIFSSISESLAIIVESRVDGFAPSDAAVAYFLSLQCSDGGFDGDILTAGCVSGLDETSYAVAALSALGGHGTELAKALAWLKSERSSNGSWSANTDSTGLAASALGANGADVSASRAWLASQQVTVGVTIGSTATRGALRFGGKANVRATNDGLLGLAPGAFLATLTAEGASADAPVLAPTSTVGHSSVAQGAALTATGVGFSAGESVRATVHSAATVDAGTVKAGSNGTAKLTFSVPTTLATGGHTLELTGLTSGLTTSTTFTVTAAPATISSSSTGSGTAAAQDLTSTLPATGTDRNELVLQAIAGATLVSVGALALLAGRRRRA
jgi:hypothetical protein